MSVSDTWNVMPTVNTNVREVEIIGHVAVVRLEVDPTGGCEVILMGVPEREYGMYDRPRRRDGAYRDQRQREFAAPSSLARFHEVERDTDQTDDTGRDEKDTGRRTTAVLASCMALGVAPVELMDREPDPRDKACGCSQPTGEDGDLPRGEHGSGHSDENAERRGRE